MKVLGPTVLLPPILPHSRPLSRADKEIFLSYRFDHICPMIEINLPVMLLTSE
jgi:hypothetical protein